MPDPNRLFKVPDLSATKIIPKPERLNTPEKQQAYKDVIIHFEDPAYQVVWIPTEKGKAPLKSPEREGMKSEKSPLTDAEKVILVSISRNGLAVRRLVLIPVHQTKEYLIR